MNVQDKLKLLSYAEQFIVTETEEDKQTVYDIDCKGAAYYGLSARIYRDGETHYYVSGIYNSGTDYAEIDIDAFRNLVRFCKLMTKDEQTDCGWK